jgi:hypothetical protein
MLKELMKQYGTDKLDPHNYDSDYVWHFQSLRDKKLIILEIGIGGYGNYNLGGESLQVWRDYFPFAEIHGLDIERKNLSFGDRVHIWRGDQNDPKFLINLIKNIGNPDIIIDDGSHVQDHIFTSFFTLFPLLQEGGIYVIEDLATSYSLPYGGDPNEPPTIRLIQGLIDIIHWQWSGREPNPILKMVKSVHVSKELVFIYKQ